MERVQFQQEQMLAELKDLVQKGLFSQSEIKQIMKKRTAFETALIRRIPKKGDFLRYAAYEMSLEALRRKRIERLNIPKGTPTISDYALVRRQFQIFERALKKFKEDVGLWVQYIQTAQRAQARALVSRICGRALQLHPNSPALYILAASHELKHLSHAAARVLLQRGIRMNSENVDLWREYVKMEMGFAESLRRRWDVLGLKIAEEIGEKDGRQDVEMGGLEEAAGAKVTTVSPAEGESYDEQARKEILNGALVKTVISSAVKAIPTPDFFNSIHTVLTTYPCPPPVRRSLLDHLHSLLHSTLLSTASVSGSSKTSEVDLKTHAQAAKLYATRFLTPDLEGDALVDALRRANEDLMEAVQVRHDDEIASAYAQFVSDWFGKGVDEHLNLYLLASLQSLCSSSRSPSLSAAHLRLLRSPQNPSPLSSAKLLKLARKYASRFPKDIDVWLLRLKVELALEKEEESADWRKAWEEARKQFMPKGTGAASTGSRRRDEIWLWGLEHQGERPLKEQISELESLLRETQAEPSSSLSERLLVRYIRLLHQRAQKAIKTGEPAPYKPGDQSEDLARVASHYLPGVDVWAAAFDIYSHESHSNLKESAEAISTVDEYAERDQALRTIYETWRLASPAAHAAAALRWAGWLVRYGRSGEAARVIANARTAFVMDEAATAGFDQRWRTIVDNMEKDDTEIERVDSGDELDSVHE